MAKGWEATRRRVIARDKGICGICHKPGANSADHIIPHSKGGNDDMNNLQAAHMKCNERKNGTLQKPIPRVSRFG